MAKGLVSNYTPEDEELIERFEINNIAIEFGDSLSDVETWRTDKIEWAKTTLKVRENIIKSKVK